jgi:hypothetical protein
VSRPVLPQAGLVERAGPFMEGRGADHPWRSSAPFVEVSERIPAGAGHLGRPFFPVPISVLVASGQGQ